MVGVMYYWKTYKTLDFFRGSWNAAFLCVCVSPSITHTQTNVSLCFSFGKKKPMRSAHSERENEPTVFAAPPPPPPFFCCFRHTHYSIDFSFDCDKIPVFRVVIVVFLLLSRYDTIGTSIFFIRLFDLYQTSIRIGF